MQILIFGTGFIYEQNRHRFKNFDIVAFLDNDKNKQGKNLDGIIIDIPENNWKYEYDFIIIASVYYKEMRSQLLDLGVPGEKIIDEDNPGFFSNISVVREYNVKKYDGDKKKKILLVMNELTNTGAPRVLFNMAQVLIRHNYEMEVITRTEGPMLYTFLASGISVKIVDFWKDIDDEYLKNFHLIILNTILTYPIAQRLADKNQQVLWWIHEDAPHMSFFHIKNENIPVSSNIHPLAVGKRVEDAYIGLTGSYEIEELCYGLEYHIAKEDKKIKDKIICAVIGYVNEVKGQDLLLRAIEKNERKWNGKIEFWVIGSISQKDRTEFEKYTCVRVWGLVEHKSLMEMYSEIDMVLCPSRHETMSVAVVEGMMHRKLCIISSETGNARYCEPFKNALIMENENVDSLSENIDWVLEHPDECKRIADAGFEVYDKKFRMESFEENVIRIVTKYCRKESLVE